MAAKKRKVLVDNEGKRWYFDPEDDQWMPFDDESSASAPGPSSLASEDDDDGGQRLARKYASSSKRTHSHKHKLSKWIYVTGLPLDASVEAVRSYCARAGIVKENADGRPCVRLDPPAPTDSSPSTTNSPSTAAERLGRTALVRYFKPESVPLAITLLDQSRFDPMHEVRVSLPPASLRDSLRSADESSASRKQTALMGRAAQRAVRARGSAAASQEALLSWSDAETRRHVILRHMFDPATAREAGPQYYDELRAEVLDEVRRLGRVEACFVFRGHPDGAVALKFADPEVAAYCVRSFHGRFFDGRSISAEFYDGATDLQAQCPVSDLDGNPRADDNAQLEQFGAWLDDNGVDESVSDENP